MRIIIVLDNTDLIKDNTIAKFEKNANTRDCTVG